MLPTLLEVEDEDCKMLSVEEKWKLVFKEDVGPPMYRADEYAVHLMRWLSEGVSKYQEKCSIHNVNNDEEQEKGDSNDNVYLKELSNITDLLRNLKIDLKLAHTSFHTDFLGEPHNGVHLLLNTLKTLQGLQSLKPGPNLNPRDVMLIQKHAVSDEYECLISLKHATQCQDAMKMIIDHPSGLYLLAMSSIGTHTKSRIVGLQLLTQACPMTHGHDAVLKAFSTVRLTVGEPVRFKLLIGMLNSPGTRSLLFQAICINFLNTLLETSHNACERVYIQCEMEEAGLDIIVIEKFVELKESEHYEQFLEALKHWKKEYVDVENLVYLSKRLASDNIHLRSEVDVLKKTTKKLEEDKINLLVVERELSEQCIQLEKKITTMQRTISDCESQLDSIRQRRDQESLTSSRRRSTFGGDVNQNHRHHHHHQQQPQQPHHVEGVVVVVGGGSASSPSHSPEAMSISSEEALRAQHDSSPERLLPEPTDLDVIVPHIQHRTRHNLWGNGPPPQNRGPLRPPLANNNPSQRRKGPNPRSSNSDYASLSTEKEEEEWHLSWRYPDIPQPIAIISPVKNDAPPPRRSTRNGDDVANKTRKTNSTESSHHHKSNKQFQRNRNVPVPLKLSCNA